MLTPPRSRPGSTCVVFGAGMVGLGAVAGCRLQGAERIVCVDLSRGPARAGPRPGRDRDAWSAATDAVEQILEMTGGFGADYTFEATGNVEVMRQAVEAARMGWGLCTVAGVAGKGETLDIVPRFLITGRRVAGSSFGGVKGREQVPQLVERYLAGDIDVDAVPLAPHHARRGQPRLRADGGPGRHPQRDLVLMIDHVKLFVPDAEASRAFYEAALEPLGYRVLLDFGTVVGMGKDRPDFWLAPAKDAPPTRCHIAFRAESEQRGPALPRGGTGGRRHRQRSPRPQARTTTRTTTARSPSTPTATTPRPSTTERCSPSRCPPSAPRSRPRAGPGRASDGSAGCRT